MKNYSKILLLILLGLNFKFAVAQEKVTPADTNVYIVETTSGTIFKGTIVESNDKELVLLTKDVGRVAIPKLSIKSIIKEALVKIPVVAGRVMYPNPHPSRYLYSPSAMPLKKGEGYAQAIYYLVWQVQYAVSDHISIGATTSYIGAPFLLNIKYATAVSGANKLFLTVGAQAGNFWFSPGLYMGIGYVGFTFGDSESNFTVLGGYLGERNRTYSYLSSGGSQYSTQTQYVPAITFSFNQRVASKISLLGEVWYVGNRQSNLSSGILAGGPGMRIYAGKKTTIDFAL